MVQLTRDEVDAYLEDRAARGFNTLLVNLIEHKFARTPPANAYGQVPFSRPGDFSTPNEAYFAHVDWVVQRAASKGFLLLLVPALAGYDGGEQGWYRETVRNGPAKMRDYGRFLGRRYARFANIMWVHGGDYNPPDRAPINALVAGIREYDRRALHTAHAAPETAAADFWGTEGWLDVNTVYTYGDVRAKSLAQHARPGPMPFFFIEGRYENEAADGTPHRMRVQAYEAVLSGAMGHVFGNNPIWHFDGPGLYPARVNWRQALDGPGSRSMSHVHALFASRPWWTLAPDVSGALLSRGIRDRPADGVAAVARDRSFAVAYLPRVRTVSLDLGALAGPGVDARWFDPASGAFVTVPGSPFPAKGAREFRPSSPNAMNDGDWVLLLESRQ
jgi:hypothetical protein